MEAIPIITGPAAAEAPAPAAVEAEAPAPAAVEAEAPVPAAILETAVRAVETETARGRLRRRMT